MLQRLLSPDLGLESVEGTGEEEDWACCPWPRPLYLLLLLQHTGCGLMQPSLGASDGEEHEGEEGG